MKIKVVRADGRIETITLAGTLAIQEGGQNCLHADSGQDHFFLQDGTYDGWGMALAGGVDLEQAGELIEHISASRDIAAAEDAITEPGERVTLDQLKTKLQN